MHVADVAGGKELTRVYQTIFISSTLVSFSYNFHVNRIANFTYFMMQSMEKWLPYIRQILGDDHKRPVVLVGNKTDLTDRSTLDVSLATDV